MNDNGAVPENSSGITKVTTFPVVMLVLAGIYVTTFVNYLLFHSIIELVSIVIAFSFFMIAWNARQHIRNSYFIFAGTAYLFIGFLDLLHMLSYKGMSIFPGEHFYANQLWIAARAMESVTLLAGLYLVKYKVEIHEKYVMAAYSFVTAVVIGSVFWLKVFPECFVAGEGQTAFKRISEYVICGILAWGLYELHTQKRTFEKNVYRKLFLSIVFTVVSELAFTFYISNYGLSNLVGHYFKLASFWLLYEATIQTGVQRPYQTVFYELYKKNRDLKNALDEIQVLQGILPICMHCRKVRDDAGYWGQIEDYISAHSETRFTHGLCEECAQKYYSDIFDNKNDKSATAQQQ